MAGKDVYTTGEIARFCNVKKLTVIRWIERGELPAHQLPGRGDRRVTREDLATFLRANGFPLSEELESVGGTILVVDDEESIVKATCSMLKHQGYETQSAADGFQAGFLLKHLRPSLVILDLMMPGINGYDVLTFIRGHEELRNVKVLIISAMSIDRIQQAMEAGADDYLVKPFRYEALIAKVAKLTGIKPKKQDNDKQQE